MKYLFFDIECADGNRAICEYGFVLTDEKFNVIRKRNILMDPECKFNLTGRASQEDLTLTYLYSEYYKYYPFTDSYDFIKNLMTQNDLLIFGHAVNNDISFLSKACERYHLPLFDYTAYDIQSMLPIFSKSNKKYMSLEAAFVDIVPENIRSELKDHRACDDAMKTMLVFKSMVVDLEFTPKDLIESCPKSEYHALEYSEKMKERRKEKDRKRSNGAKRLEGKEIWNKFCSECEPLKSNESLIGKYVWVSGEVKENKKALDRLIVFIKNNEYVAISKIQGSDFLITLDENNKKELVNGLRHPYAGQIITLNEFYQMVEGNKQ